MCASVHWTGGRLDQCSQVRGQVSWANSHDSCQNQGLKKKHFILLYYNETGIRQSKNFLVFFFHQFGRFGQNYVTEVEEDFF